MASAVIAAIVLTVLLPNEVRAGPRWLLPGVEGLLLVALVLGDPGGSRAARPASGCSPSAWSACWRSTRCGRPSAWSTSSSRGEPSRSRRRSCSRPAPWSGSRTISRSRCCTGSWTGAARQRGCGIRAASPISPSHKSSVRVSHPRGGSRSSSTTCTWRSRTPPPSAPPMSCRWQGGPEARWRCRR